MIEQSGEGKLTRLGVWKKGYDFQRPPLWRCCFSRLLRRLRAKLFEYTRRDYVLTSHFERRIQQ